MNILNVIKSKLRGIIGNARDNCGDKKVGLPEAYEQN